MVNYKDAEFVGHDVMTYLAFYKIGERRGQALSDLDGSSKTMTRTFLPANVASKSLTIGLDYKNA
jgi:hypothetical protein